MVNDRSVPRRHRRPAGSASLLRLVTTLGTAGLLAWFSAPPTGAGPLPQPTDVGRFEAAAPVVGPERPVSDPVDDPVAGSTTIPDIAFDGTNHLVVWTDDRTYDVSGYDIYGSRITTQGTVLDPGGIAIVTAPGDQSPASIAFGGGTFLVTWSTGESADIAGTRVSPAGTVLDPGGFAISQAPGIQANPDVAYGDGNFLVAWDDARLAPDGRDVFGARVSPDGTVLDPAGIALSTGPGWQVQPSVAFGVDSFLVAWLDYASPAGADVVGARVGPTGSLLDPAGIPIGDEPGSAGRPAVAFNGTDHLVVWQDGRTTGQGVFGARVDRSGVVLDPDGITVSSVSELVYADPVVTSLGTTFLVGWYDNRSGDFFDAVSARVDGAGRNLDPEGRTISEAVLRFRGEGDRMALAADGSNYFAAWMDVRIGPSEVFGAPISAAGSVLGPGTLIPRAASSQSGSAIAFDGTNHLVVWTDRSGSRADVRAARLSATGRKLDVSDILVSEGRAGVVAGVVFDGVTFVVAWVAGNQIHLTRVSADGYPGAAVPLDPLPGQYLLDVDIVAGDAGVLVTWQEVSRAGSTVRAVRVSRADVVLDPTPLLISDQGSGSSVTSDGHDYLVAWRGGPQPGGVRVTRVTADGVVVDPAGILVAPGFTSDDPAVAWNGSRYLVAWSTSTNGTGWERDIFAARVGADGSVQDQVPLAVATGPGSHEGPRVAGNGHFLIAWRETDGAGRNDVFGARVGDDGAVLDPSGFPIAASAAAERDVALTAGPGATWSTSSTRFVVEQPYGADRVFLRTVSPK
jgi:hypothetical protein